MRKTILILVFIGLFASLFLPWYANLDSFITFSGFNEDFPKGEVYSPAILQMVLHKRWWLLPIVLSFIPPILTVFSKLHESKRAYIYILSGGFGIVWMILQSLAINIDGLEYGFLKAIFGTPDIFQEGIGLGATIVSIALISIFSYGLARRGFVNGDVFVVGSITIIIVLIALFIFYPITTILGSAFETNYR